MDAKEVIRLRDGTKGTIISRSVVLVARDGFSAEAMKVFRRSKRLDYLSETHWPNGWPEGKASPGDIKSKKRRSPEAS